MHLHKASLKYWFHTNTAMEYLLFILELKYFLSLKILHVKVKHEKDKIERERARPRNTRNSFFYKTDSMHARNAQVTRSEVQTEAVVCTTAHLTHLLRLNADRTQQQLMQFSQQGQDSLHNGMPGPRLITKSLSQPRGTLVLGIPSAISEDASHSLLPCRLQRQVRTIRQELTFLNTDMYPMEFSVSHTLVPSHSLSSLP